jgi:hypothetical protein
MIPRATPRLASPLEGRGENDLACPLDVEIARWLT